jgi:hypothetical protein
MKACNELIIKQNCWLYKFIGSSTLVEVNMYLILSHGKFYQIEQYLILKSAIVISEKSVVY